VIEPESVRWYPSYFGRRLDNPPKVTLLVPACQLLVKPRHTAGRPKVSRAANVLSQQHFHFSRHLESSLLLSWVFASKTRKAADGTKVRNKRPGARGPRDAASGNHKSLIADGPNNAETMTTD